MIARPTAGQSVFMLASASVTRTWDGKNAASGFFVGVNICNERACRADMSDCADSIAFDLKEGGMAAESVGGDV